MTHQQESAVTERDEPASWIAAAVGGAIALFFGLAFGLDSISPAWAVVERFVV